MDRFQKTAVAAIFGVAALGLTGAAQAAFVPETFTVDETQLDLGDDMVDDDGNIGTTGYSSIEADGFGGDYNELLTVAPNSNFDATAWWKADSFNLGGSTASSNVTSSLVSSPAAAERGYGLYVIFDSSGILGTDGFTGDTGDIEFWLDPDRDTTFAFGSNDAADGVTVTAGSDDIKVGDSTFLRDAAGTFNPNSLDEGSFALLFDEFELTDEGSDYFVDPEPFFEWLRVTGQFDTSEEDIVAGEDRTSFEITNSSANGQFGVQIPTPGVIGLFGIGLVGLGLVARRRKPIAS